MTANPTLNGHQVRSERSTRLLVRAAGELVAEGGYQSMTLATVGERAGYSRSLATARFGSKGKLLEALVDEIVHRWDVETVAPVQRGLTGLDALHVMLTGIKNAYAKNPKSLTILYALIFEAAGPVPELRERFIEFHRGQRTRMAEYIRNGLEDGSIIPGVDPEQQAAVIVAQLRGVGYLWKLDPESIDSEAVLATFIDQTYRALATDPAAVVAAEAAEAIGLGAVDDASAPASETSTSTPASGALQSAGSPESVEAGLPS
ncbi:TetR/AcrR family transcriptional regulator [Nocardioides alkalitolerans]|uniref:TetR/AcrR family transcriptional regulator n=1 Tax=Nocardioides alkalitolerans TaxID=281714 RepID=UPI00041E5CEB|nr:TetR/AcrR family transcriptional regulator [Nocardioides alkalitolerans]